MEIKKNFNIFYLQLILFIIYFFNPIQCDEIYRCSSGIKVLDELYCPHTISCPDDLMRINFYTCGNDQNFAPPSKCKTGRECWNGDCVNSEEETFKACPTHISCPKEGDIKCPDNTCVSNKEECPNYVECPSFNPIRCGNGDCRKNLNDCPSLIHCPNNFPIICNDGSCRRTQSFCKLPTEETTCYDKKMIRCSDGTCTNSKLLCQTLVTCPKGYEKCWDGNCKLKGTCSNNDEEVNSLCDEDNEILCQFDFSCAKEIDNCPTGIICPLDKPVKCWDNSCRDSVENCPEFQKCPLGLKECPDGSCGLGSCGTHITCSVDAPFRCFDNTCRKNPEDCPAQPSCPSETPILCWDGRCLAERGECLSPSSCDRVSPVKCPNGFCTKSAANCKEKKDCPTEFVRCKDGTCRKKLAYCPSESCPVNLPYKCKNGLCVSNEKYCDKDNGCPFYLPIKCSDGSCAKEEKECPLSPNCDSESRLCPDGSCLNKNISCPSINGCPINTPFRCANGECINLKKTSCSIPICDSSVPVKCFDGTCVSTVNYCPIERKTAESGNVICADGTEAHSYDECKPLVKCNEGVRCNDGSCRSSVEYCPKGNTCPNEEIRCDNGACAKNRNLCPKEDGCTFEKPYKCPGNGLCVQNYTKCEEYEKESDESNGCPRERPYKCAKFKKCVSNEEECLERDSVCSSNEYMCPDGFCTSHYDECFLPDHEEDCSYRHAICLDEKEVCADTIGDCFNSINCKVNAPFRCGNGECKRYPSKLSSSSSKGCELSISCPNYKPYLCADGSCVEKSSFCKSYSDCPEETHLCFDKTCSSSEEDCEKNHKKCPAKSPVLCPNGNCVAGIYDCDEGKCPKWIPYYCILGSCSSNPRECQKIEFNENFEALINTTCNDDEYICVDGSCRPKAEDCPIYIGCVSNEAPFKCLDGGCAVDKDSCNENNNETLFDCPINTILCEDGVCRKNCDLVEYNGCPNEHPLLCSNGRCVSQLIECVGESACDSTEKPFRCIDGTCGASLAECKIPFREVGDTNILISVFPKMELIADLIIGPNNILAGKVEIPAGTITTKEEGGESIDTQISFRSVPRSVIVDTKTTYDKTRVDDLKSVYPYADPNDNYSLNYQYTVLSSAIEIKLKESNTQISGKLLLTLLFDFPYKHEKLEKTTIFVEEEENYSKTSRYTTLPLNYNRDVCLAKLNIETRKWECNKLNFNVEAKSNLQLTGEVNEEGIYAVVLELGINDNKLYINENWFIANLKLISIIILILLFLIGVAIYIFSRIYRYRIKYKGTKEIYKGFELELSDLQDKSVTGRQGQTYGDVKEGIIYTDNIAFKSQIDSEARKKNTQLEKIFDAYTKKLRLLERNNALLKGQYDSIKNEYNRLNNYKDTLKDGDQVKIEVNIKDPSENQDIGVGVINDDEDD